MKIDDAYLIDIRLHYDNITQRLRSVTRHQGQEEKTLVTYTYDAQQRLVQVTNADKRVTRRFGWDDELGLMVMHQYPTGLTSHYRWQRFDAFTIEDNEPEWRVVEHWLEKPVLGVIISITMMCWVISLAPSCPINERLNTCITALGIYSKPTGKITGNARCWRNINEIVYTEKRCKK